MLVDLERVSARTPDRTLFDELSLTISTGDRIGVVGINGTGKSTLLRVIAGVAAPESGEVRRGRGARVGYLDQEADLPAGQVLAAVGEGWEAEAILERLGMGSEAAVPQISELSGGQAKRVALARVLAQPAELLVLDEPTNHLDLTAIAWLERHLASFRGALRHRQSRPAPSRSFPLPLEWSNSTVATSSSTTVATPPTSPLVPNAESGR